MTCERCNGSESINKSPIEWFVQLIPTHLGRVESRHLKTLHRRGSRQRDVSLTLFEYTAEVDLDTVQRCTSMRALAGGLMQHDQTMRTHSDPDSCGYSSPKPE